MLTSTLVIAANISTHDYYINYKNDFKLHLKQKHLTPKENAKVIILVNPLSIPAIEAFDVPNYSLMDTLAAEGFEVALKPRNGSCHLLPFLGLRSHTLANL